MVDEPVDPLQNDPQPGEGDVDPTPENASAPEGESTVGGDAPPPPDEPAAPTESPSDDGPLSQEDIDLLASHAGGGATDATAPESTPDKIEPPEEVAESDSGALSQADIDAALGEATTASTPDSGASDSGVLSQADVDAALGETSTAPAQDAAGSDSGELSQADIDAALSASPAPPSDQAKSPQDEIDEMLAAAESAADQVSPEVDTTKLDSAGRPFDAAAAAMAAAIEEEAGSSPQASDSGPGEPNTTPVELPDFSSGEAANSSRDISILKDVDLKVHVELGRTLMYIEDVLRLSEGSVVELDNLAGDPVEVYVNGRLVARGEVLVLSDNFCVRVSEIVSGPQNVSVA